MSKNEFDLSELPPPAEAGPNPQGNVEPDGNDSEGDEDDEDGPMTEERMREIDEEWNNNPLILNARETLRERPLSHYESMLPEETQKKLYEYRKKQMVEKKDKEQNS